MPRFGRKIHVSPWPVALILAAIAMAVGVFAVTQGVQTRESRVAQINRDILAEQQSVRVLNAEWAYLTRPQRLQTLMAMQHDAPEPTVPEMKEEKPTAPAVIAQSEEPAPVAKPALKQAAAVPQVVSKAVPVSAPVTVPAPKKSVSKSAVRATPKAASHMAQADDVWHITRRTPARPVLPAPKTAQIPAYPRAGVAHPIVE
ncbi:MAG: hypothetical protein H6865_05025 [Rhodospirillales bacterium]|nr:hypothetical protein [Alphaproteobacteria bacterium]MCB9986980.1 hypothetical protein [Rhodospirillales bacterium]USO08246.1 MAG: hypothetical protein H6866_03265 [Rhodospirillales bacterium]